MGDGLLGLCLFCLQRRGECRMGKAVFCFQMRMGEAVAVTSRLSFFLDSATRPPGDRSQLSPGSLLLTRVQKYLKNPAFASNLPILLRWTPLLLL